MDLCTSVEDFFSAHVGRACGREGVLATPGARSYLVGLLAGYTQHLIDDQPLALRMKGALDAAAPAERRARLREIGDTSLFVSGFFAERLERGAVGVDYYIGMGECAYGTLASGTSDPTRAVFGELAERFAGFVRVLHAISETCHPDRSPADLVKLYERWRRTGSRWARARLAALGVQCELGNTTRVQ